MSVTVMACTSDVLMQKIMQKNFSLPHIKLFILQYHRKYISNVEDNLHTLHKLSAIHQFHCISILCIYSINHLIEVYLDSAICHKLIRNANW